MLRKVLALSLVLVFSMTFVSIGTSQVENLTCNITELRYREVKILDGASESFSVSAWDKTSNSWLSIVPTLPQILSCFSSTVQSLSNKYGQNNWVYVSQSPYNY